MLTINIPKKGDVDMTRLELMTILLSLEALLEEGKADKALEVIRKILREAETIKDDKKD